MLIDCDSCVMRPRACGDCVVSFLLSSAPAGVDDRAAGEPGAMELHSDEQQALEVLASSGLVPPLRLATAGPAADADGRRQLPVVRRVG